MASKVQLRDLLLAVACVAVLLGALQPLMPTIALVGETRWLSLWSFQWIGLLLLFGAAVLSAKRWVFSCATLLAFVSAAAMTTVVLSVFVTGEDPLWLINQWSPFWFPIGAAMASMVLFLLPYRLRGWRISRRPFFSKSHLPT